MKLFVVFGQRKETYEGQYAPEALSCIDEYGNDDNPDYLIDELAKYQKDTSFEKVEIVAIEVSQKAVLSILRPNNVISGMVVNPNSI